METIEQTAQYTPAQISVMAKLARELGHEWACVSDRYETLTESISDNEIRQFTNENSTNVTRGLLSPGGPQHVSANRRVRYDVDAMGAAVIEIVRPSGTVIMLRTSDHHLHVGVNKLREGLEMAKAAMPRHIDLAIELVRALGYPEPPLELTDAHQEARYALNVEDNSLSPALIYELRAEGLVSKAREKYPRNLIASSPFISPMLSPIQPAWMS